MKATQKLFFIFIIIGNSLLAKTINIPSECSTIQQGIDKSTHGDTVLVSPGTYFENINFEGKNIALGSLFITTGDTSYINTTIIDGNEQGTVITFESGEDSTAELVGFTITNGVFYKTESESRGGAGIVCSSHSSAKLEHIKVINNFCDSIGGSVVCLDSSLMIIRNVTICDNTASGLLCANGSEMDVKYSDISRNYSKDGGGVFCENSFLKMKNVNIYENTATSRGGGLNLRESTCELVNVNIRNNRCRSTQIGTRGAGLYALECKLFIDNATVADNKGMAGGWIQGAGSGISLSRCEIILQNSKITGNSGGTYGGGIYSYYTKKIRIVNTNITDNAAGAGGGLLINNRASLVNVVIENNHATGSGGGLVFSGDLLQLKNVTVKNNTSEDKGGGIHLESSCTNILLDQDDICSIYLNRAANGGGDIYYTGEETIDVTLDTFTVSNPSNYHIDQISKLSLSYQHTLFETVNADLYVSPRGSNDNNGLSEIKPLKTISYALLMIEADSLQSRTIHIMPGLYSYSNTEPFPIFGRNHITLQGYGIEKTILDGEQSGRVLYLNKLTNASIKDLTIQNGYYNDGSALYVNVCSYIILERLRICNNKATYGSITRLGFSSAWLKNVIIVENSTTGGCAGIRVAGADVKLINSTIANNIVTEHSDSDEATGGVVVAGYPIFNRPAELYMVNSILWNQELSNLKILNGGMLNSAYSNIKGGYSGIEILNYGTVNWLKGNIDSDPLFVGGNPYNYRLTSGSPCVDKGIRFYQIDGDTLIYLRHDEYIGIFPDMGAFEYDPSTGALPLLTQIPTEFKLHQNYPNPFSARGGSAFGGNPTTTIRYELPENCFVQILVYDILGRDVALLVNEQQQAGIHEIMWNGKSSDDLNLPSGVYFYKINAGGFRETKKLLLVR